MDDIALQLRKIRKQTGLTQADFARKLNVATSTIASVENGSRDMPKSLMRELVKQFDIDAKWLLTGEGEMFRNEQTQELAVQKAVRIPLLRQSVSCGPGIDWTNADNIEGYIEPITAITRGLKHLYALHASGTSMVGAGINDGDLLFFNADEHQPISDDIYIFAFAGDVYCKFLRFDKLGMRVKIFSVEKRSLEEMELIKIVPAEDPEFHLFGRVICWVRENRIMHRRR